MIIQNYMALLGGIAAGLILMPCAIAALPVEVSVVSEAKFSTVPYYSEWPSLESAIKKRSSDRSSYCRNLKSDDAR